MSRPTRKEVVGELPEGIWSGMGNGLYVGNKLVATCRGGDGSRMAVALAETLNAVDLVLALTPDAMLAEVDTLMASEAMLIAENAELIEDLKKSLH